MVILYLFLQDLLNCVDIVDVVGWYVQFKKGGVNFMGLCLFYNEKSLLFIVSLIKQFYYCFGCGVYGMVIGFLMEYVGFMFLEVVQEFVQFVGLIVLYELLMCGGGGGGGGGGDYLVFVLKLVVIVLFDVMMVVCDYYCKQLCGVIVVIQYLKNWGLIGEIVVCFGFGYVLDGWQNFEVVFLDYCDELFVEVGFVIVSEKIDVQGVVCCYDWFCEWIMFLICNVKGQVIGFGGCVFGSGELKYLNLFEILLFNKGSELYGLFEVCFVICECKYVLVVEGYMDVVVFVQFGFLNVVVMFGIVCMLIYVQKLLCQIDMVIFSFDGDLVGWCVVRCVFEVCLLYVGDNWMIWFFFLLVEYDLDSYVCEFGVEVFFEQVECVMLLL